MTVADWPLWDVFVVGLPIQVVKAPSEKWAMTAVERYCIAYQLRGRPSRAEPTTRPDLWDGWTAHDGARIGDVPDLSRE